MARWIAQGTTVTLSIGPFLASSDGITPQTGLTPTVRVMRGGSWNARSSATAVAHQENGFYSVELDGTDTGTLGRMRLAAFPAATVPVWEDFMVVPVKVWDALVAGSDNLEVDTIQWLGTAVATPTVAGVPEIDVTHWGGAAIATPVTAGVPDVALTGAASSSVALEAAAEVSNVAVNEPVAVFTWPATMGEVLGWIGALSRNKVTQTDTTQTLRNDADSATIATSSHGDVAGTYTRSEWS